MYIREMLQELNPYILEGSGEPDPEKAVVQLEFYRYARGVRPTHIYLAEASELEALSFPAREEPLVLLVSCADGAVPDFPFPQGYVPVYLHRSTGDVVKTITDSIKLGVVPLQVQVPGVCLRVGGDLIDAGVPQVGGRLPFRLPQLPPLGIRRGLVADQFFQVCHWL